MEKIKLLIKKNFKVFSKNKFSLFALFLSPMLIILIMGLFFYSENSLNINVGYVILDNPNLVQNYINDLKANKLNTISYKKQNSCLKDIKLGLTHICIIFPQNFTLENNKKNQIILHYDSSKATLSPLIENLILKTLEKTNKNITLQNANSISNFIYNSEATLTKNQKLLSNLSVLNQELENISNEIKALNSKVTEIFNLNDLKVSQLEIQSENINSTLGYFYQNLNSQLNSSNLLLESLNSQILSANVTPSTTKSSILSDINDLKADILNIEDYLKGLQNNKDLSNLKTDVSNLKTKLENIDDSFNKLNSDINQNVLSENNQKILKSKDNIKNLTNNTNFLLSSLNNINLKDTSSIIEPISVKINKINLNSNNHLSSSIPYLFLSLLVILSLFLSSNFIVSEKNHSSYFRMTMTKTNSFIFVLANYITLLLIVLIQITIIILIYNLMYLKVYSSQIFYLLFSIFLIASVFILLGFIIGYFSKSSTAQILLLFLFLFLLFVFSGNILPLEFLTTTFGNLLYYNPYLISESILRKIILFNSSFVDYKFDLLKLFIYTIILFLIVIFLDSISKKKAIYWYYVSFEIKTKEKLSKLLKKIKLKLSKQKFSN